MQDFKVVDTFIKYNFIDDYILNEHYLLNEGVDIARFKKQFMKYKNLFIALSKIKTKKQALRFFRKNEKILKNLTINFKKLFPVDLRKFDPFENELPPPITTDDQIKQKEDQDNIEKEQPKIPTSPKERKQQVDSPADKMKVESYYYYNKIKQFIIKLFKYIQIIFKTEEEIDYHLLFDKFFFFLMKSAELTILIALYKVYGPAIFAIVAAIGVFATFLNLIYIKMNNSEKSYGDAFRESVTEIKEIFRKLFLSYKIYKEEFAIVFLGGLILYLSNIALTLLSIFSWAAFGSMLLSILAVIYIIYFILLLIDRLSTEKYKEA